MSSSKPAKKRLVKILIGSSPEDDQDKAFAARFSEETWQSRRNDAHAFLKKNGATLHEVELRKIPASNRLRSAGIKEHTIYREEWRKNGVRLDSLEGFSVWREGHQILLVLENEERILNSLVGADGARVRAMRYAYEAGQALVEFWAYQDLSRLGRKSLDTFYDQAFLRALTLWRKENPGVGNKRPKWEVIVKIIKQSFNADKHTAGDRGLQNRWQKWYKKTAR